MSFVRLDSVKYSLNGYDNAEDAIPNTGHHPNTAHAMFDIDSNNKYKIYIDIFYFISFYFCERLNSFGFYVFFSHSYVSFVYPILLFTVFYHLAYDR